MNFIVFPSRENGELNCRFTQIKFIGLNTEKMKFHAKIAKLFINEKFVEETNKKDCGTTVKYSFLDTKVYWNKKAKSKEIKIVVGGMEAKRRINAIFLNEKGAAVG